MRLYRIAHIGLAVGAVAVCGLFAALSTPANAKGERVALVRCPELKDQPGLDLTSKESVRAALSKEPPIFLALERGSLADVQRVLSGRPSLKVCALGFSPLILAASGGPEAVALLLDAGAEVDNPRDSTGSTALHEAVSSARWDTANLLLKRGADPRVVTDGGTSLLHRLAMVNPPESESGRQQRDALAREFIRRGVPVDGLSGVNRTTPLMFAAISGSRELVSLLLESGANPHLTNKKGESALSFARRKNHDDIVHLLEQASSKLPK